MEEHVPYAYGTYVADRVYLEWPDAHMAMRELSEGCDHPETRVIWKLQTYEYVCRACQTVFPYDDLRKIIDDAQKD
jgi:hypothetical protein